MVFEAEAWTLFLITVAPLSAAHPESSSPHIIMDLIQASLLKSISQSHLRLQTGSQETMQVE